MSAGDIKSGKSPATTTTTQPYVVGELKGKIYHYGTPNQAAVFNKVSKAIAEHASICISEEMWSLMHDKKEAEFEEPKDPGSKATKGELEKYKMLLKMVLASK